MSEDIKIELPDSAIKATKVGIEFLRAAPHYVALLVIVGSFLWFLNEKEVRHDASESREDLVANMRIASCRDVQERSIQVLESVQMSLAMQEETFVGLERTIHDLNRLVEDHLKRLP